MVSASFRTPCPRRRGAEGDAYYFLKRVLLEQADVTAAAAVAGAAEVCSSSNYVLTDGQGRLADVVVTPEGSVSLDAADDLLVHTNHFHDPAFAARDALLSSMPDSAIRNQRMADLLNQQKGRITLDALKAALADDAEHLPAYAAIRTTS